MTEQTKTNRRKTVPELSEGACSFLARMEHAARQNKDYRAKLPDIVRTHNAARALWGELLEIEADLALPWEGE